MLVWIAAAMLAAAAALAVRWWLRRFDALGRPRGFPVFSVAVLALVGMGLFVPVVRHARLEDRLGEVASVLVGKEVVVECQSGGEAFLDVGAELGYVRYRADGTPEPATLIKRAQCKHLASYLGSSKEAPSLDQIVAVHILTHEAMHMSGSTVESEAECLAMQRDAETARLLGASPQAAAALARRYWHAVYPRMRDDYRTLQCGPGLELDRHLPDPPWGSVAG